MFAVLLLFSVLPATQPAHAPHVQAFLRRCEDARAAAVRQAEALIEKQNAEIAARKAGRVRKGGEATRTDRDKGVRLFDSADAKRAAILEATDALKGHEARLALAREANVVAELPDRRLQTGDIGRADVRIIQIIDQRNAVAALEWNHAFIAEIRRDTSNKADIWMTDYDTAGKVDGRRESMLVEVVGTKQYESTGGMRTVLLVKPFEMPRQP